MLHGFSNNEDAVLVKAPPAGLALVQTVDILGPIGNNARLFGQTAAANALSDVYAMGGWPWSVMNIAAFPSPSAESDTPLSVLADILSGAMEKVGEAGAVLAGGHTLDDEWIKFGLSVTGVIDPAHVARNDGLVPGDALILTKPLGTGVLATAVKAKWPGSDEAERDMYRWTTRLNANASSLIRDMGLRAATDVTGFGVGGHVLEMAKGSGGGASVHRTGGGFCFLRSDSRGNVSQPGLLRLSYAGFGKRGRASRHAGLRRADLGRTSARRACGTKAGSLRETGGAWGTSLLHRKGVASSRGQGTAHSGLTDK